MEALPISQPVLQLKSLGGIHILLVDDIAENRILIKRYLERAGARVELAINGEEGIAKAISFDFDLVLMDIQMPILDGLQATKALRRLGYRKPIVALTTLSSPEDVKLALQIGFNAHLAKPIACRDLVDSVHKTNAQSLQFSH